MINSWHENERLRLYDIDLNKNVTFLDCLMGNISNITFNDIKSLCMKSFIFMTCIARQRCTRHKCSHIIYLLKPFSQYNLAEIKCSFIFPILLDGIYFAKTAYV